MKRGDSMTVEGKRVTPLDRGPDGWWVVYDDELLPSGYLRVEQVPDSALSEWVEAALF